MIDPQPIALAILTSIITGGFVLVLVEIGNRKNRENFFVSKRGVTDRDSIKQIKIEIIEFEITDEGVIWHLDTTNISGKRKEMLAELVAYR